MRKKRLIPSTQLDQHGGGQQTSRRREEAPGYGEGGGGGELPAGGLRDAVSQPFRAITSEYTC